MSSDYCDIPALATLVGADAAVPEFKAYVQSLSDEKFARLQDTYNSSNISPNHSDFEGLLQLIEDSLRTHQRCQLELQGGSSDLDDRILKFALEAGLENCARELEPQEASRSFTAGPRLMEIYRLKNDIEDFANSTSGGQQPRSQGARPNNQQVGGHPAQSSYRRPDARPRDTPDQHRGPPPSNSYRHSGPSRQSGQASHARPRDTRDQPRDPPPSNSYRHSGPSRQSGQASHGYGRGQASRRRYQEEESEDGDW